MRLLIATMLAPLSAAAGAVSLPSKHSTPTIGAAGDCPSNPLDEANREGSSLRPCKLGRLPKAHAFSAVNRHINGCEAAFVIGDPIGGP